VLAPFALRSLMRLVRRAPVPARAVSHDRATLAWRKVERALARRGFARLAHETPLEFALRVRRASPTPAWTGELDALVQDYYSACFDPQAQDAADRFPEAARDFLKRMAERTRLEPARG